MFKQDKKNKEKDSADDSASVATSAKGANLAQASRPIVSDEPKDDGGLAEIKKNLEECRQKAEDNLAGWKRARADYDNLKKEFEGQKSALIKFANLQVMLDLLPIMNNFDKAFSHVPEKEKDSAWVVGLSQIKKQLEDLAAAQGVEKIKTEGEAFNPALHEAMGQEKKEGIAEGMILQEVKAGYKMNGRVIEPAGVIVAHNT